jgi:putative redox protein
MKAPTTLELTWDRDLIFHGTSGRSGMTLDSAGIAGPSPVQTLAFALAGCMGMDLVYILQRGRFEVRGVTVSLVAERAQEDPHRITAVTLDFAVTGDAPEAQVRRALDLSHDKYCSVWHSMRQDIAFVSRFTISA